MKSEIEMKHHVMVFQLVKPPEAIIAEMTPDKMDLIHAVLGICGEAGELLDAVKKHAIYNKEIDGVNVIEELGDLEFYLEQLRQRLDIDREDTLKANISKLRKRYASKKFSNEQASERADKKAT